MNMTRLEDIEKAVAALSKKELEKFSAWFEELQEQLFDEKIERDAKAGKLDKLAERALANYKAGRVEDL